MVCWVVIMKKRVFCVLYYSSSKRLIVQGKKEWLLHHIRFETSILFQMWVWEVIGKKT